ncbi:hypothetical protein CNE_BB1p04490 (plasmid) [Cupriavidus necator N-1]|uniref:Uncharacterized protein n=1 Tax=Cupriavidus necator (strain ATCC 43291 / DSM 13513 / CCUG 52238 / LMG 8453 / N-1) TaxID=1042878 RepID=F8GX03_CUPNN|nr:MaoC/PaaZ C-terminal domain-containing protein [Cupriavidus necator]AEI81873.1 hypothetical protein CNE_BB1p04490 [Cupriavidus necator N-1]MDX6008202.1 MaoC/PaaZ C-terminal domain-containing protein [Cupriavidus necator]
MDIVLFAAVSGDNNAVHIDEEFSQDLLPPPRRDGVGDYRRCLPANPQRFLSTGDN